MSKAYTLEEIEAELIGWDDRILFVAPPDASNFFDTIMISKDAIHETFSIPKDFFDR